MAENVFEQILKAVKAELENRLNKKIDDYNEIDAETGISLVEEEGLPVYSEFKDKLTTPWAIARYMKLNLDEKEMLEKVRDDLKELIPEQIDMVFVKRLSCEVQFTKKFEECVKRQLLIVKYYLDEDDNIQYKLTNNGSNFCWDISKAQLKALLGNKGFTSEKFVNISVSKKESKFKRWLRKILGL